MELSSLFAGLLAFGISVLASALLIFVTYRVNTVITRGIDEEGLLRGGNRSVAIALGAIVLGQAVLLRHAVFPTMAVVRDLFIQPVSLAAALWVAAYGLSFFVIIGVLSMGSVAVAAWLFSRMTGGIHEVEEILKDNQAIAILFAFVVLGITLVVNEGLDDLSRSIIPYGETGVLRLP
jgi:uncharacterized membrane protein YjfL (UPF0719 family)